MNPQWCELTSLLNLFDAAGRAAAGKRSRPDVAAFRANLEGELYRLQRQLTNGSYRPGPYHIFRIVEGKPRLISAAPFRDRVVHHALTNIVEPIFERRFVPYSFACRRGFGTHKALAHAGISKAELTSLLNLFDAAGRAADSKKSRPDVAAFRANLEPELYRLQRQLADGSPPKNFL